ncbi:MAG: hypothetical protein AAFU68_02565 [Pseudomonadota bacterium]
MGSSDLRKLVRLAKLAADIEARRVAEERDVLTAKSDAARTLDRRLAMSLPEVGGASEGLCVQSGWSEALALALRQATAEMTAQSRQVAVTEQRAKRAFGRREAVQGIERNANEIARRRRENASEVFLESLLLLEHAATKSSR